MLTISKPLNAAQTAHYHTEEFANASAQYFSEGGALVGQWHGRLAAAWGLVGGVDRETFDRLAEGRHPTTDEQLVRHRTAEGAMAHRSSIDLTWAAPKSVSLAALVGADTRIREAHEASVDVALDQLERFAQARISSSASETTGNLVIAKFSHDSARPVDGVAAVQLHVHALAFNLSQTSAGRIRPLQPLELYRSQQYATAVYRSELAVRLTALGYDVERGANNQPEIRGFTPEYLKASSPRRQQIVAALQEAGRTGPAASEIAQKQTREAKVRHAHEVMQAKHQAMAEAFGHQAAKAVAAAKARGLQPARERPALVQTALTYATDRNIERAAVVDERAILRDALVRTLGRVGVAPLQAELDRRVEVAELLPRSNGMAPARAFTTPAMVALERETLQLMADGRDHHRPLGREPDAPHLNASQREAVRQILANRDTVMALEGVAGGGKTTALAVVKDAAEQAGYHVQGLAPTSRAAQVLATSGLESQTLQRHLQSARDERPHLYVLDEASLSSTVQMHQFFTTLRPADRVLLVGDTRQHQSVEAGRIYEQLQEAGVQTARIQTIVRQADPAYRSAVEQLARGETTAALRSFDTMGRVHQVPRESERLAAVAQAFVADPAGTIIVSPDNRARTDLNRTIHSALTRDGVVREKAHTVTVLEPRQDLTGPDRAWAARYAPGDHLRYAKTSRVHGIAARDYAEVLKTDATKNLLTVRLTTGRELTYDPSRLTASVYRPAERSFAVGDRVQFTTPYTEKKVANRQLGTIAAMTPTSMRVKLESGRSVGFRLKDYAHLDYGYAVTSYSAQGQTADRVLLHLDSGRSPDVLVNQRMAYVSLSRGRYDAQVFCDDRASVTRQLSRDVSHRSALEQSHA